MRAVYSFFVLLLSCLPQIFAQETSAHVLDAQTRQPVPYASVQYAAYRGVITNEEGFFSIPLVLGSTDVISISSLGYESLELKAGDLRQADILLKPTSISLKDVFLTNKNLSGKEIVARIKKNVPENYDSGESKKRFFFRESSVNLVRQFDLRVEKSSIPELDQELMDRIAYNVPKKNDSYKEVLGDLYGNYDIQKVQVIKAANLHNPNSKVDLERLTGKLEQIFDQNVKENSYLKIKSGIIGVKMDAEEFGKELKEENKKAEKTAAEKEKELEKRRSNLRSSTQGMIGGLLKTMFWKEDMVLDVFEKSNKYEFKLEGVTGMESASVYVISFRPKRGADFRGKMYVNTLDYGIYRLDYENVKPLKKFRLFGISTVEDVYRGTMIYTKNGNGKYEPRYLEREKGEGFGIDRPLTIIEKNKFVKGRRKQNELDLDVKMRISQLNKYQLVIYESEPVQKTAFEAFKSSDNFDYQTFKAYNADFWNGFNIMEPNAAIKAFTLIEEEEL